MTDVERKRLRRERIRRLRWFASRRRLELASREIGLIVGRRLPAEGGAP